MKKRKLKQPLTIAEAAKVPKRHRRTKKEMEAARAQAAANKRETVEAVYMPEGCYPLALCPKCGQHPRAFEGSKGKLPDLKLKHKGRLFTIRRSIYPCSTFDCKTDVVCHISATLSQQDILFFLDPKRLPGGQDRPKLLGVMRQNTKSSDQPNAPAERKIVPDPASPKRVKRK